MEVISASELSQMTKGETTGQGSPKPDPSPGPTRWPNVQEIKPPTPDLKRDVPMPAARPRGAARRRRACRGTPQAEDKAARGASAEAAGRRSAKAEREGGRGRREGRRREGASRSPAQGRGRSQARPRRRPRRKRWPRPKPSAKAREAEALAKAKRGKPRRRPSAGARRGQGEAEAEARPRKRRKAKEAATPRRQGRGGQEARRARRASRPSRFRPSPQPKPDTKFDPSADREAAHLQGEAAAGALDRQEVNRTASLGAPNASGAEAQPEPAGRARPDPQGADSWLLEPAAGHRRQDQPGPEVQDAAQSGRVAGRRAGAGQQFRRRPLPRLAESAIRAIRRCAPFRIPAQFMPFYDDWRDWNITFDPKEMLG